MLHRLLLDRRLIATVAATLSIGSALPAISRADASQVTVVSPGGSQGTLALDAMAGQEDVVERDYVLRSAAGGGGRVVSGFSLGALLVAADADPYGFSYLEVKRPSGGSVLLSRHQALDPGTFADGPPVFYAAGGGTGFLRPSAGPDDLNGDDSFEAPRGIAVVLRKGSPLRVRADASPRRTRPGRPVRFSAVVERAGSGESLSYSWYFDDGGSATGASSVHSFAKRGSYDVVVGVTSAGDDAGASAVVTIQVGAPTAGPDRKGGGGNRDAAAPDHGAAVGSGGGHGGGPTAAPAKAATGPAPDRPAQPGRRNPRHRPGERVSGELLDTARESQTETTQDQAAARRGRLSGHGGGPAVPVAAWGLFTTLGLLGAGALIEARGLLGQRVWVSRGGAA
jgi:hypothetical protein